MENIGTGLFETNSSSCHKIVVPFNQEYEVPKILDLDNANPQVQYYVDWYANSFIPFLYGNGVETIIYNGTNQEVIDNIDKYKGIKTWDQVPCIAYDSMPRQVVLMTLFGKDTVFHDRAYSDMLVDGEDNVDNFTFMVVNSDVEE